MMELQTHMHVYVAPSIAKEAKAIASGSFKLFAVTLAGWWADQRWDGDDPGTRDYDEMVADAVARIHDGGELDVIGEIAEVAIERSECRNDFGAVYIDAYSEAEWCSEEFMHDWIEHGGISFAGMLAMDRKAIDADRVRAAQKAARENARYADPVVAGAINDPQFGRE